MVSFMDVFVLWLEVQKAWDKERVMKTAYEYGKEYNEWGWKNVVLPRIEEMLKERVVGDIMAYLGLELVFDHAHELRMGAYEEYKALLRVVRAAEEMVLDFHNGETNRYPIMGELDEALEALPEELRNTEE